MIDVPISAAIWLLSLQILWEYVLPWRDPGQIEADTSRGVRRDLGRYLGRICAHWAVAAVALLPYLSWLMTGVLLLLCSVQGLARHVFRGSQLPRWSNAFRAHPLTGELVWLFCLVLSSLGALGVCQDLLDAVDEPSFYCSKGTLYILTCSAGLVFVTRGGTAIIRRLLQQMGKTMAQVEGDQKAARNGRMIGNLERVIILLLGLGGEMSAIGFVLAAKSVARFKSLEEHEISAEYYIVGTLASALIALVTASALKYAWSVITIVP